MKGIMAIQNKLLRIMFTVMLLSMLVGCSSLKNIELSTFSGTEVSKSAYVSQWQDAIYIPHTVNNEFVLLNTRWGERAEFMVKKTYKSASGKKCIKANLRNSVKEVLFCNVEQNYWLESRLFD
jgi:hypothetical protein